MNADAAGHILNDSLQLSGISQRVFNHHLAHFLVLCGFLATLGCCLVGEVNVAVADDPAAVLGELDDVAFGI